MNKLGKIQQPFKDTKKSARKPLNSAENGTQPQREDHIEEKHLIDL